MGDKFRCRHYGLIVNRVYYMGWAIYVGMMVNYFSRMRLFRRAALQLLDFSVVIWIDRNGKINDELTDYPVAIWLLLRSNGFMNP